MEIKNNVGAGDLKFGMTLGQALDVIATSQTKVVMEHNELVSKRYRLIFKEGGLNYIILKQKGEENIQGVKIGSSLYQAVSAFGCLPRYVRDDNTLEFGGIDGVTFELSGPQMEELYELGAYENDSIEMTDVELKKQKIRCINIG